MIDPYYRKYRVRRKRLFWIKVILMVLTAIVCAFAFRHKEEKQETKPKESSIIPIQKKVSRKHHYVEYFKKSGSKHPNKMADAVLATKKPKLLAAMAVVETKANPTKRNTGFKNRHHGAWQVNPKFWGSVSNDPIKQALQVENILDTLSKKYDNLSAVLNKYGGSTQNTYSKLILAELKNTP